MKRFYTINQQFIACLLLVSLFLQSCGGASDNNPLIPIEENQIAHIQTDTQQIILPTNIQPLFDQALIAQGGHAITLYEEAGELKADVEMNTPQGFSKDYKGLAVALERGTQLSNLPHLSEQAQQRRIHLQLAQGEKPAHIVIYKGVGLMGGMLEGEEEGSDLKKEVGEKDHKEAKRLEKKARKRAKQKARKQEEAARRAKEKTDNDKEEEECDYEKWLRGSEERIKNDEQEKDETKASKEETTQNQKNKRNKGREKTTDQHRKIYHSRESYEFTAGLTLNGGPVRGFGPKPRSGGLGPKGTVEISPWVRDVTWVKKKLQEGESLEFVFDPDLSSVYVGAYLHKWYLGHLYISDSASIKRPYGGNIEKRGESFRTDELSGHFGVQWCDQIRFKFIQLMSIKGIYVLHEPWVRDSILWEKNKALYLKKLLFINTQNAMKFTDEEYEVQKALKEQHIFKKLTNEQLSIYQDNFLRKFGISIFNPGLPIGMTIGSSSDNLLSDLLYEKDPKSNSSFSLKEKFRGKGTLDLKFYNYKTNSMPDPEELETLMFEEFSRKFIDSKANTDLPGNKTKD
ncbi:MAG: polymorphic toxin type 43 domain-containing protein [Candidatus Amoebophilus sp.]